MTPYPDNPFRIELIRMEVARLLPQRFGPVMTDTRRLHPARHRLVARYAEARGTSRTPRDRMRFDSILRRRRMPTHRYARITDLK